MTELLERAKSGDRDALNEFTEQNKALVIGIAKRFCSKGVEFDDIFQLGALGLIKAVRDFDPAFGVCFSTYAVPKISGEIKRFLRDDGIIKVSRDMHEKCAKISAISAEFLQKNGREAYLSELSELTGFETSEIALCLGSQNEVVSINAEISDDFSIADTLGVESFENSLLEKIELEKAIETLSELAQKIIKLRFYRCFSQQKTAKILNISQIKVSREERKALSELKRML